MKKFLIGPALTGAGWLAGSYYGASAQQIVHKGTDDTYTGISQAIDNMPQSGTTSIEGGKPTPFEVKVDRELDKQLIVHLLFDGREGGRAQIDFTPQGDGSQTLVTVKTHGEKAVLSDALAGTSRARLAYAPDWMLNMLTVRPLLQQWAQQIEGGQQVTMGDAGPSQADWESSLPADKQKEVQEYREYKATAPTTDPNADAQRYMSSGGTAG